MIWARTKVFLCLIIVLWVNDSQAHRVIFSKSTLEFKNGQWTLLFQQKTGFLRDEIHSNRPDLKGVNLNSKEFLDATSHYISENLQLIFDNDQLTLEPRELIFDGLNFNGEFIIKGLDEDPDYLDIKTSGFDDHEHSIQILSIVLNDQGYVFHFTPDQNARIFSFEEKRYFEDTESRSKDFILVNVVIGLILILILIVVTRMRGLKQHLPILFISIVVACQSPRSEHSQTKVENDLSNDLPEILDTIFQTEQTPIRIRDSLMKIYGPESEEAQVYQRKYRENHEINIVKVLAILDQHGWPDSTLVGDRGGMIICNVLQHASEEIRVEYLPMMKQAVLDNKLPARYLVRAEDRLATERGELQIYGGQMKYYPETQSFNVWPVYDPVNIDKRRAEIGLGPIAEHLKNRFDFEWDLDEQIKRTDEFIRMQSDSTKERFN